MSIGGKIKFLMQQKNLTQKQIADMCDLTESAVSKYINDERKPRVDILLKMSEKLGVGIDYFMEEKITEFVKLKDMVARNANTLSPKEKLELMNLLSQARENDGL